MVHILRRDYPSSEGEWRSSFVIEYICLPAPYGQWARQGGSFTVALARIELERAHRIKHMYVRVSQVFTRIAEAQPSRSRPCARLKFARGHPYHLSRANIRRLNVVD